MARSFNGTTDLIDFGNSSDTLPATAMTFAVWFNPSTLSFPNGNGTYAAIGGRNSGSAQTYIIYLKSTGHLAYYSGGSGGTNNDPGTNAIIGGVAGNWNHLAFTISAYSGTNCVAYLNGAADATFNTAGRSGDTAHFQLGADTSNPGTFNFPGLIAESAIWDVALDANEIAALAKGLSPLSIRTSGLVIYWPLIGRTSPEIDVMGSNTGTLTGTAAAAHPRIIMPRNMRIGKLSTAAGFLAARARQTNLPVLGTGLY